MKLVASLAMLTLVSCGHQGALSSNVSDANSPWFPRDATSVGTLDGTLVGAVTQWPRCPTGTECQPSTVLRLRFSLSGCSDRFVGMQQVVKYVGSDKKPVVSVAGLNVHSLSSESQRCDVMPTVERELTVRGAFTMEQVTVRPLRSVAATRFPIKAFALVATEPVSFHVRSIVPSCFPGMTCPAETEVLLYYSLVDCGDELGPVQYEAVTAADGKTHLHVGATDILHAFGPTCVGGPMVSVKLRIPYVMEHNLELKPLPIVN